MSKIIEVIWRQGYRYSSLEEPEVVLKELEKIRAKHGGEANPEVVVEAARAPRNKLHKFFEWDDNVAAQEYRFEQARSLTRSIKVIYEDAPDTAVRFYETEWKPDRKRKVYRPMEEIMKDPDARRQLLQRALGELIAMRTRYKGLQELSIVFRAVDDLLETIEP
jgi:hypothetical protein